MWPHPHHIDTSHLKPGSELTVTIKAAGKKLRGSQQKRRKNFFSRVNFMWYPFHPCVTAVARKRPWSFCQMCRLQLNMHARICGFAWSDMVYDCMVHAERTKMAAVSCGTSHVSAVSTPLQWIFKNTLQKASHSCRITCKCSGSAQERYIKVINNNNNKHSVLPWSPWLQLTQDGSYLSRQAWLKYQAKLHFV